MRWEFESKLKESLKKNERSRVRGSYGKKVKDGSIKDDGRWDNLRYSPLEHYVRHGK